jgi:hypothetical protein
VGRLIRLSVCRAGGLDAPPGSPRNETDPPPAPSLEASGEVRRATVGRERLDGAAEDARTTGRDRDGRRSSALVTEAARPCDRLTGVAGVGHASPAAVDGRELLAEEQARLPKSAFRRVVHERVAADDALADGRRAGHPAESSPPTSSGPGNDVLSGGPGKDRYVCGSASDGVLGDRRRRMLGCREGQSCHSPRRAPSRATNLSAYAATKKHEEVASSKGEPLQQCCVSASPSRVEVRGGRADSDELRVHVHAVGNSNHVTEQPSVLIDPSVAGSGRRRTRVPGASSRFVVADACGP